MDEDEITRGFRAGGKLKDGYCSRENRRMPLGRCHFPDSIHVARPGAQIMIRYDKRPRRPRQQWMMPIKGSGGGFLPLFEPQGDACKEVSCRCHCCVVRGQFTSGISLPIYQELSIYSFHSLSLSLSVLQMCAFSISGTLRA